MSYNQTKNKIKKYKKLKSSLLSLQDNASISGPNLMPILKYKHIYLTAFFNMWVDFAGKPYNYTVHYILYLYK